MSASKDMNGNSRRTFIRNSSIALTAVLAAGSTNAATIDAAAQRLALLQDSDAIRILQQRCFLLLERGDKSGLSALFNNNAAPASSIYPATQLDSRLDMASINVAGDRLTANARFQGRVQLGAPITGNSTLQQMARMQGMNSTQWWEQGVYEAQYVKVQNEWKLSALSYHTA